MLSIAVVLSPALVGAGSLITVAVGSGLMMPSLQALATTSAPEEISGGVLGVYNASTSLGIIIGTVIGGPLFDLAYALPFIVAGAVLLFTLAPALFLNRRERIIEIAAADAAADRTQASSAA
jgi:predicted MFS family arabinose efflux permease